MGARAYGENHINVISQVGHGLETETDVVNLITEFCTGGEYGPMRIKNQKLRETLNEKFPDRVKVIQEIIEFVEGPAPKTNDGILEIPPTNLRVPEDEKEQETEDEKEEEKEAPSAEVED